MKILVTLIALTFTLGALAQETESICDGINNDREKIIKTVATKTKTRSVSAQ
jgi:hypothetical protein